MSLHQPSRPFCSPGAARDKGFNNLGLSCSQDSSCSLIHQLQTETSYSHQATSLETETTYSHQATSLEMAFWADPDDLPRLYPHNHSQCVEYLAYVTQEVPASLFPSSEGSSNHFDTPDASISVKTTSGSKQEELYTRPHLVNSTASLQTTQGSHFTPGTIGTAALTNSYPGSGSVDSILMQVHGSVSGLGSTQDMFQRGGDSTPEHPGEMYEYGGNHDRKFIFKIMQQYFPHGTKWQLLSQTMTIRQIWLRRIPHSSTMGIWPSSSNLDITERLTPRTRR